MKVGLKDMKKAYKNVKIDKIEVPGFLLKIYFNRWCSINDVGYKILSWTLVSVCFIISLPMNLL